jgi:hypothetical protein
MLMNETAPEMRLTQPRRMTPTVYVNLLRTFYSSRMRKRYSAFNINYIVFVFMVLFVIIR